MAEDATRKQQEARWTAALEKMGRDIVRIRLNNMLDDPSATFKLPDQPGCKRGYAEAWIARKEAATTKLDGKRFRYLLWPTLVAALGAAIAAWPVIHEWIIR